MKLERLDYVPDEVDRALFKALVTWSADTAPADPAEEAAALEKTLREILADKPEPVLRGNADGSVELSGFGVLNGLFMYFCPGYRLMVTEGPNEPRRLWVAKET